MNLLDLVEDERTDVEGYVMADEFLSTYERERPQLLAFDTESPTYKWHLPNADPFCLTFSWGRDRTFYVPCTGDDAERAAAALYAVLTGTPTLVAHPAKYDLHVAKKLLDRFGYPLLVREIHDTLILSHVLDEKCSHALKDLCASFDIRWDDEPAGVKQERIADWRAEHQRVTGREAGFDEVPPRLMVPYAMQDAYLTLELFRHLTVEMDEQVENGPARERKDLRDIYTTELSLQWVLFAAEERGIRVDLDFVNEAIGELTPKLADIRARLREALNWAVNPGSTDDVVRILETHGYDGSVWLNPATGQKNLPEWRMQELVKDESVSDVVRTVLDYRTSSKMLNSYFLTLKDECALDSLDQHIVRCNTRQVGARTGRTSITEPALQTIPREKGDVRGAFVSRVDHKLIYADYQGQELRLLAHYMARIGDETMADIYREGLIDLHRETAAAIFQKPYGEVTKEERRMGKETNFAIVYGAGAEKVGWMHGARSKEDATAKGRVILERLYSRFPGIQVLKRKVEKTMRERGYVVTEFGRRHRETNRRFAYKGLNSLVQGSGADLVKEAMVKVDRSFGVERMRSMILLTVHDEIQTEAPDKEVERTVEIVRHGMLDFPELLVPLEVEIHVADRWSAKMAT